MFVCISVRNTNVIYPHTMCARVFQTHWS